MVGIKHSPPPRRKKMGRAALGALAEKWLGKVAKKEAIVDSHAGLADFVHENDELIERIKRGEKVEVDLERLEQNAARIRQALLDITSHYKSYARWALLLEKSKGLSREEAVEIVANLNKEKRSVNYIVEVLTKMDAMLRFLKKRT